MQFKHMIKMAMHSSVSAVTSSNDKTSEHVNISTGKKFTRFGLHLKFLHEDFHTFEIAVAIVAKLLVMTLLDNDVFIKELEKMYFNSRTGGAKNVAVTFKRYDGRTKPGEAGDKQAGPASVLVRAVHGHKKISTVVQSKEVNNFTILYSTVIRASMDNLERRKKTDEEKAVKPKQKSPQKKSAPTDSAKGTPTALKK